ncbi:MAG: glucose-6-phosphate isomerase [Pleomorphochaeta sp.]
MESTNLNIEIKNIEKFSFQKKFKEHKTKIENIVKNIDKTNELYSDSLGWLNPFKYTNEKALNLIDETAKKIKSLGSVLVLIGIGGSNQGARAVVEALDLPTTCEVIWAGNNLSSHEVIKIFNRIGDRDFSINVIAKNFETIEPGLAFRIFRDKLIEKYGKKYSERVFCTGTINSYFYNLCKKENYSFLNFEEDLGGRFSIFSNVGLLPIAVSNIDIHQLCSGLNNIASILENNDEFIDYVAFRTYLNDNNYPLEMMSFFEDRLFRFGKWWTQLIGESEGKDDKGIFPIISNFSEDLHSIGQFIQEGTPLMFETFIKIENQIEAVSLQKNGVEDHFDYINDKTLLDVNKVAEIATIKAHEERLPVCVIKLKQLDEKTIGELMYFYMYSTYISCIYFGINPFSQPGVEMYKKWMFKWLGK